MATAMKIRKVTAVEVAAVAGTMETMLQGLLAGDGTMRLFFGRDESNVALYKDVLEGLRNIHKQVYNEEEDVKVEAMIEVEKRKGLMGSPVEDDDNPQPQLNELRKMGLR